MSRLASWMRGAGETDETLAAKTGVSRVQISRIRRGISRPSPEVAAALEALSNIPAWEFIKPDAKNEGVAA